MSEYVRQELLDEWIVAHDKQKARAEAAEAKLTQAQTRHESILEDCARLGRRAEAAEAERDTASRMHAEAMQRLDKIEALRDEWQTLSDVPGVAETQSAIWAATHARQLTAVLEENPDG